MKWKAFFIDFEGLISFGEKINSGHKLWRLISATEHLTGKLHKSEVVLITSTLLVEKSETIYQNTAKMYKTMKAEVSHSAAFRSSAAHHKDVHGLHQRCDMAEEKIAHLYGEKMVCW